MFEPNAFRHGGLALPAGRLSAVDAKVREACSIVRQALVAAFWPSFTPLGHALEQFASLTFGVDLHARRIVLYFEPTACDFGIGSIASRSKPSATALVSAELQCSPAW